MDWNVSPLTRGTLGVEVSGVALTPQIGRRTVQTILELVNKHGVVLFRNQCMTPSEQVECTRLFGPVETHSRKASQLEGLPEIFRVASLLDEGHVGLGRYWHADGLAFDEPPALIVLRIVVPPRRQGETTFANAYSAWQALPADLHEILQSLRWTHTSGRRLPFVRVHPRTRRHALLVNLGQISIPEMESASAADLLHRLDLHLSESDSYSHTWREGDVVIADNCAVLHRACVAETGERRILDRTVVLRLNAGGQ